VFYESLFKEKGVDSEMALVWCVEHGVFQGKEADQRYAEYMRRGDKSAGGKSRPSAVAPTPTKPAAKSTAKKSKGGKIIEDVADVDVGGMETVGRITL
jgi:hypothetical protein